MTRNIRDTDKFSLPLVDTRSSVEVFVVSGLPRSGTSLLMQMLHAGGMDILSDHVREADEDNPRGYFEFEPVKRLLRDQSWLGEAHGKAVKIIVPLVCSLPSGNDYRVLLMERDFEEILESQAKMIARRGEPVEDTPERRALLHREYARLMEQTKRTLSSRADMQLMPLRYEEVLSDPAGTSVRINRFAGGWLDEAAMGAIVDPSLYRHRRCVPHSAINCSACARSAE